MEAYLKSFELHPRPNPARWRSMVPTLHGISPTYVGHSWPAKKTLEMNNYWNMGFMDSLKLTELTHQNHPKSLSKSVSKDFQSVPLQERGTKKASPGAGSIWSRSPTHILPSGKASYRFRFVMRLPLRHAETFPMPKKTLWTSSWRLAARVSYVFICHFSEVFRVSGRCPEFHAPCRGKPHIWSLLPEATRPMRKMRSLQSARIPLTMLAFAWKILTASSISAGLMTDSDYKRFELIIQTA